MISAEFIVNTGPYQHVKLSISGVDVADFGQQLAEITDTDKANLGRFQAELESWVRGTYEALVSGDTETAQKLLESALGATVLDSIPNKPQPALSDSDLTLAALNGPGDIAHKAQAAWNEKPETVKPAPWKAQASTSDGDDW